MAEPTTVGVLIKRLRKMLGHLSAADRRAVSDAIEAIHELTVRLHEATHPLPVSPRKASYEVVSVEANPLEADSLTPRATGVITDVVEVGR